MLRIIKITLFSIVAISLFALMGFIIIKGKDAAIKDVEVNIFRSTTDGFLTEEIILMSLNRIDTVTGITIKDISLSRIEEIISLNPYVSMVDGFVTLNGMLKLNVKEKTPVLRIYNKEGKSIYIDASGDFVPLSSRYTPRVVVASGYIDEEVTNLNTNIFDTIYNNSYMRNVYDLFTQINKNNFLRRQIGQVYVNSKGEYDLVPVLGEHLVKLGTLEDIDLKLENLEAYYRKNLTIPDWDNYRTVNLAYKDQIVCTKK